VGASQDPVEQDAQEVSPSARMQKGPLKVVLPHGGQLPLEKPCKTVRSLYSLVVVFPFFSADPFLHFSDPLQLSSSLTTSSSKARTKLISQST